MNLLLHICCGPCAAYPIEQLRNQQISFTGLYYNPNIHPLEEFERRRDNLKKLEAEKGFAVIYQEEFWQEKWEAFQGEILDRCYMCYDLRFDYTAREAKARGYDAFSTTLLVSPYQRHEMIIKLCEKAAETYQIPFYYEDWRPGFREGQSLAREYGLYRQKYCGCIKSKSYE